MIAVALNFFIFILILFYLVRYKINPYFESVLEEAREKVLSLKNKRLDFLKEEERILEEKEEANNRFKIRTEEEAKVTKSLKDFLDKKLKDYENFLKQDLKEKLFYLEQFQEKKYLEKLKEKILINVQKKIEEKQESFSKKMVFLYDEVKKNL